MSSSLLVHVRPYCIWALAGLILPLAWLHSRNAGRRTGARRFDDDAAASRIPRQENYSPGPDPGLPPFLEMGDPRSADCIVRDISATAEGSGWRWTYLRPTLRFHLKHRTSQRFAMDFTIVEIAFRSTGPVMLSCLVNGRLLAREACRRPGNYHLERDVPETWLNPDPVLVEASLDKVWTAPADGARLGYVLLRAGFRQ